jgi:16S rRNA (guanine966-N2)-methyltransferase
VRVIAGTARGRPLSAPPGSQVRPTADRVREALFSALSGELEGAEVLDLFAGSGALGIEALSRGAASATFVEQDPRALAAIAANLDRAGVGARARVVRADALTWDGRSAGAPWRPRGRGPSRPRAAERGRIPGSGGPPPPPAAYDLALADPPYAMQLGQVMAALRRLATDGVLAPGAHVVVERDRRDPHLEEQHEGPLTLERDRVYGDTVLRWLRVESPGPARPAPEAGE